MYDTPGLENDMLCLPPAKLNSYQMILPSVYWILHEPINDKKRLFLAKVRSYGLWNVWWEKESIPREKGKEKICTYTYVDGNILSTSNKSERPEDLEDCKCWKCRPQKSCILFSCMTVLFQRFSIKAAFSTQIKKQLYFSFVNPMIEKTKLLPSRQEA